jgi:hypothetical protein
MTNQRKLIVKIVSVIAVVILSCTLTNAFAYDLFWLPEEVDKDPSSGDFDPEDYYSIDPDTIIPSLDNGVINVFSPAKEPDDYWPDNASYSQWQQSHFVKVASALNKFAGKDNIDDWKIVEASFISVCEAKGNGFLTGYFILYRPIWVRRQLHYEARAIFVDPMISVVSWGDGRTYHRPILGWNDIPLDKFAITAEKALMIAEEHGGKQIRAGKGNQCNILVTAGSDYWLVTYSSFTKYSVDAYTGEITLIRKD